MKKFSIGGWVLEVVQYPLETLSQLEQDNYCRESVPITRAAFGSDKITESDVRLHALDSSTTVFLRDNGEKLMGFSSSIIKKIENKSIIYLQGTVIKKDLQGKGLYGLCIPLRIMSEIEKLKQIGVEENEIFISTRTQSPIIYKVMTNLGLFPQPFVKTPAEITELGEQFAQELYDKHSDFRTPGGLNFDKENLVMRNSYDKCMYGENIPFIGEQIIDDFMKSKLNFQNGDAFVILGKYNPKTTAKILGKSLTKIFLEGSI